MRFLPLLFLFSFQLSAQIIIVPLGGDQNRQQAPAASMRIAADGDTLSLPFLDEFSTYTGNPQSGLWEASGGVFVNEDLGVNPPSYHVASFDGLDATGQPYNFVEDSPTAVTNIQGATDSLTSKPIDLSQGNDIALSFYWQKGGIDDALQPRDNSNLSLYFLDQDSVWNQVWPADDTEEATIDSAEFAVFNFKFINITDPIYLHGGFQFQFRSTGLVTGNRDLWNVDYVYLDSNRTKTNIQDFAFQNIPSSLLNGYRAVPSKQFWVSPSTFLNDSVGCQYVNLSDSLTIVGDSSIIVRELVSGLELDVTQTQVPNGGFIQPKEVFDISYSPDVNGIVNNLQAISGQERLVLENSFNIGGDKLDNFPSNDAVSNTHVIDNYFAYDDGTAETGFGMVGYGLLAVKYELLTSDQLYALEIYFPKIGFDLEGQNLNLRVWKTLEGVDNATTTEVIATIFTNLTYSDMRDGFQRFEFSEPLDLEAGPIYVGYEQNSNRRLLVGFDNNSNGVNNIYANLGGGWNQDFIGTGENAISGALMLRPSFGEEIVSVEDPSFSESNFTLFPNPLDGQNLHFNEELDQITVYDLEGRILFSDQLNGETQTTLPELKAGMYLVEMVKDGQKKVERLMVR